MTTADSHACGAGDGNGIESAVCASDDVHVSVSVSAHAPRIGVSRAAGSMTSSRLTPWRWSMRPRGSLSVSEHEYVAPTEALIFLEVRPSVFAAIWWAMVLIHTVCAVILTVQTRLYMYLRSPHMSYYVNLVEPDIGSKYAAVAALFGVLSAFHWHVVLRLTYYSLTQRKYAFFPASYYETEPEKGPKQHEHERGPGLSWWQRARARVSGWRLAVFGRRGLLGVESRYFYQYFYLRETVELTSQIYQAYRGSLLVGRAWINHLSVAIIVVNCLCTPAIQIHYKKRPEVRRIAMLTLDAVLDFLTAMVVPLSIFSPYYLQFDRQRHAFPAEKLYDETWFINAVLENQEFLIVSVADIIFKTIPHISITGCLKKVRQLVRKDTSVRNSSAAAAVIVYATHVAPKARRQKAQEKMERIQHKAKVRAQERHASRDVSQSHAAVRDARLTVSRVGHKYGNKLVRLAFVAIGLGVAGIHLQGILTSYRASKISCKQVMRPWLAPAFACSIVEIDCQKLQINGSATDVRLTLAHLYPLAIAALVFTNCAALEMPVEIADYNHLMRLDVYNSTIVRWPESAALRTSVHPVLASVSFVRVLFADGVLPDGLLSDDFPNALRSVELSNTNLTDLPVDLHTKWHHAMTRVLLENAQLTKIPETLRLLDVETLSLEGNAALEATVDGPWLQEYAHEYQTLALACNPLLTELPASIHADSRIRFLRLQHTNVSVLPVWITGDADQRVGDLQYVLASHTPLCRGATAATATTSTTATEGSVVKCDAVQTNGSVSSNKIEATTDGCGLYPMALVDAMRRGQLVSPS